MQLKDHPDPGDSQYKKKVWLTEQEVDLLMDQAGGTEQKIGIGLGVRSGLRTKEITHVDPQDIVDGPSGTMVRVWEGKGSKYRETPLPQDLQATIDAYADVRDAGDGEPLVSVSTRTLRRWVSRAAERCMAETGDEGWQFLSAHDLRRTWGTLLVENECEPGVIMEWGGWEDWETFRESYLGHYSAKKQREEREKVGWL